MGYKDLFDTVRAADILNRLPHPSCCCRLESVRPVSQRAELYQPPYNPMSLRLPLVVRRRPGAARRSLLTICLGVAIANLAGCEVPSSARQEAAPTAEQAEARKQVHPSYDKTTGSLTKLEADSDHDGKIDTWAYMDGARVVRVEVDENGDGIVDRWEYHTLTGQEEGTGKRAEGRRHGLASPDKTIERIERATRHDGVIDRKEYFEHGVLVRIETDTDGDGKMDKWETYSGGTLSMMAIDTQHRGTPDRRLVYRPDGSLDRIEMDPTGSGTWRPMPAASK